MRQTLTRLGLEGRFEWIDSSATLADHGQLGRRYEAAIERCGAPAETIAYVAHCPYELRRAHESGLLTIGVGGEVGVVADAMLSGLEQLPQIIVRHTQRRQASYSHSAPPFEGSKPVGWNAEQANDGALGVG